MSVKLVYERPEMHSPYSAVNRVEIVLDEERNLDEMLEGYKQFLQAIGYTVNGEIEVTEFYDE